MKPEAWYERMSGGRRKRQFIIKTVVNRNHPFRVTTAGSADILSIIMKSIYLIARNAVCNTTASLHYNPMEIEALACYRYVNYSLPCNLMKWFQILSTCLLCGRIHKPMMPSCFQQI